MHLDRQLAKFGPNIQLIMTIEERGKHLQRNK